MKILIIYTTYSGSTQLATEFAENYLKSKGHEVTRKRLPDASPDDINNYDLTLLSSPGWFEEEKDGMPLRFMSDFFKQTGDRMYEGKKFAIFGLGDRTYARFCGAVDHIEKFISDKKGILIHPSLRIDRYYFAPEENNEVIKKWLDEVCPSS